MQKDPSHLASRRYRAAFAALAAVVLFIGSSLDKYALVLHQNAKAGATNQAKGNGADTIKDDTRGTLTTSIAGSSGGLLIADPTSGDGIVAINETKEGTETSSGPMNTYRGRTLVDGSALQMNVDPPLIAANSRLTLGGDEIFNNGSAPLRPAARTGGTDAWELSRANHSTGTDLFSMSAPTVHGQLNVAMMSVNTGVQNSPSSDPNTNASGTIVHAPAQPPITPLADSSLFQPSVGSSGSTALDLLSAPLQSPPSVGAGSGEPIVGYSPSPEPSALMLLGPSVGGLLLRRRRTRTKMSLASQPRMITPV